MRARVRNVLSYVCLFHLLWNSAPYPHLQLQLLALQFSVSFSLYGSYQTVSSRVLNAPLRGVFVCHSHYLCDIQKTLAATQTRFSQKNILPGIVHPDIHFLSRLKGSCWNVKSKVLRIRSSVNDGKRNAFPNGIFQDFGSIRETASAPKCHAPGFPFH